MSSIVKQCLRVLADLPLPTAGGSTGQLYSTARFPSSKYHRIAKDAAGNTAVLVALDPGRSGQRTAPIVLEHLNVLHAATCRVCDADGGSETGLFTVVICTAHDRQLVRHFMTLMSSLVLSLPESPSSHDADIAIRRTVQLFRALKRPGSRSIQGLWAELFVINIATDAQALVAAWRADPTEQYDFAAQQMRLEVKSTKFAHRIHSFALPQLSPPPEVTAVIASLRSQGVANGLSLGQLWDEVRRRVEHDSASLLHVDRVVVTSLGRSWRRAMDRAFDRDVARASLAYYPASRIPKVSPNVPPQVSDVRFRSEIADVEPLALHELQAAGALFAAAAPKT